MSLFTGLMIGAGVNLIYGLASVFGILNTSIQGFSNISYLMRNNPNCKDIMKIIDNELLLEVRIKVIQHFFDDLQSIKISTKTKEICEFIIKKLNICISEIMDKIKDINTKINYNNSLWVMANWRKYDFIDDEQFLRNKSAQLEHLENIFFRILDEDKCYQHYKKEKNINYDLNNERLAQSTYFSESLFVSAKQ